MLTLQLVPHRANGARAYPHTGLLGLTDVTAHGVLRTRLAEDQLPLEVSSVVVRMACYEGDISGPGGHSSTVRRLYSVEETLWEAPVGEQYAPLGDFERSFYLTVPVGAREDGAVSTLSFKTWRVWWLMEAIVYHRTVPLFGSYIRKSHPLILVNYAPAALRPPPIWRGPNEQLLLCKASTSSPIYGAGDLFSLRLDLRKRSAAANLAIKKITVELRRVIERRARSADTKVTVEELPSTPPYDDKPDSSPVQSPGAFAGDSYFPVVQPAWSKREETVLLSLCEDEVDFGRDGRWSRSFEGSLPRHRTSYHYSMGETVDNDYLTVKCYVHVRIVPTDRSLPVLEMAPTEVILTPLSQQERFVSPTELKQLRVVQDAERRLFKTDEDSVVTAITVDGKRLSVSSEKGSRRRRRSQDEEGEPPARQRFKSEDSTLIEAFPAPPELHRPIPLKLHLPPHRRSRFFSHDEAFVKPAVSPVIEESGPRMQSQPSLLVQPSTPYADEMDTSSESDLYKSFSGFTFDEMTSPGRSSPPVSPTYSFTSSSQASSLTPSAVSENKRPLSPLTTSSRSIPKSIVATQAAIDRREGKGGMPALVRVHSYDPSATERQKKGGGLARFLRRASTSKSAV